MPDFIPTYRLTHEASFAMLHAGVARAEELGCRVSSSSWTRAAR